MQKSLILKTLDAKIDKAVAVNGGKRSEIGAAVGVVEYHDDEWIGIRHENDTLELLRIDDIEGFQFGPRIDAITAEKRRLHGEYGSRIVATRRKRSEEALVKSLERVEAGGSPGPAIADPEGFLAEQWGEGE